jgi:hypothetical protein
VEAARAYQPATTVASGARQHQDPAAARVTVQKAAPGQVGQVSAGILHHLDEQYAVVLNHCPVYFAHLIGGNERDIDPAAA